MERQFIVHFKDEVPGEIKFMTVERKNIRVSKDWMDNKWVDVVAKLEILSALTSRLNPMPKVSLPLLSGSPVAGNSSQVGRTPAVKQLPTSSSSASKKAVEDLHTKQLLNIKENEDWTPKGSGSSSKGGGIARKSSHGNASSQPTGKQ